MEYLGSHLIHGHERLFRSKQKNAYYTYSHFSATNNSQKGSHKDKRDVIEYEDDMF